MVLLAAFFLFDYGSHFPTCTLFLYWALWMF
jgi:hypothetical protein